MEPAGRIDDERVEAVLHGVCFRVPADLDGVRACHRGKGLHADLAADLGKLLDGGRPVDVRRDEKGLTPFFSQVDRQLPGGGRLAGPLEAEEQHGDGRRPGNVERLVRLAEEAAHLVVYNLDELLAGGDAAHHVLPHGLFFHFVEEVPGDLVVDVGFQKGDAHLPEGLFYVGLTKFSVPLDLLEYGVEAFL